MKPYLRLKERFNFFLERQFVKGTHVQLLFIAALLGLISILGALLVLPSDDAVTFEDSLWWAFLRLSDTGYLGDDEGIWRRVVSTFLTIAGNVVFVGSLIAIIATWLNRKIRSLEQGLTRVTASRHVVILGWTNRSIHIAAELHHSAARVKKFLKRHGARSLKLIILSDDVTPERHQDLRDHELIGRQASQIILRSGEAIDREHLKRVDCANAAAIIIPSQSYEDRELITPDVETIKTLLSINAEVESGQAMHMPYVVAELQNENKLSAAKRAYSGPMEIISSDTIISRLIAQNIRHYGLSVIYNELLSHSANNNLYAREFDETANKPFQEVSRHFTKSILLGVVRPQNGTYEPILNPSADFVIQDNDRLILLSKNLDESEWTYKATPSSESSIRVRTEDTISSPEPGDTGRETNLLILGWNHHLPALVKELGTYKEEAFNITIASVRPVEEREREIALVEAGSDKVSCKQVKADYIREMELRNLQPEKFDNILLVSSDKLSADEEADARTIVGYTLLEEILEKAERRPRMILELVDPNNEILIRKFRAEMIVGPLILSNLLATIAMRRELNTVYSELFTAGGAEIIFRNPEDYGMKDATTTFSEIQQTAGAHNEIALGLFTGSRSSTNSRILSMNPERSQSFQLTNSSRLVVLSSV
ncbi:CASTOR/POLLUX-related putative ion channel [Rhodohalobacter mucosus]|uniref:Ion channel DMI1 n=1 Tax=Rhodohalobacter mucosus TaxID=2079485 RepID=A0A316TQQ8_9BACT|nr:potassium channel family protein [Rhodohalobacter mucosus]PWN06953.1 ion channel DMI1 [Rhodohalobacter mucosus]